MKAGSEITGEVALKQLRAEALSPCYLVYGEEPFFIDRILHWFFENGVKAESRDFNTNRFEGDKTALEEMLLVAKSYPMASPKRLVVVESAEKIKDPQDRLPAYINSPCPTTVLVFVAPKPDMRTKLFVTLKKKAAVIHCRPLYDNEVVRFMRQEGERQGLRFTEEALLFLKERLGKNLFLIQKEIEKLSMHLGPENREVALDRAQQVISGEREHTIFELLRALGEKDLKKALSFLSALLAEGEPPLMILGMFAREFRIMASAKEALAREPESVVGKRLSIPPFRVPEFLKTLRLWKQEEIRAAFDRFRETDLQLKGGRLAHSIVLEALILRLCKPFASAHAAV